jgi:cytochrome c biogenesis protein CcdA
VAPRFVAVAALASASGAARWRAIAAFAAGLCLCSIALGVAGGLLARVSAIAAHIDALLAASMLVFGLATLWRSPSHAECSAAPAVKRSLAGTVLLGASFGLVTSPCCTPVIVVLGSFAAASASAGFAAETIGAYALGHALPLVAAGLGWRWAGERLRAPAYAYALQVVGGALMLALAGYYGLLA